MENEPSFQFKKPREPRKLKAILWAPFGLILGTATVLIMVVVAIALILLVLYIFFHIVSVNGSF